MPIQWNVLGSPDSRIRPNADIPQTRADGQGISRIPMIQGTDLTEITIRLQNVQSAKASLRMSATSIAPGSWVMKSGNLAASKAEVRSIRNPSIAAPHPAISPSLRRNPAFRYRRCRERLPILHEEARRERAETGR
jgi:hypothetical protein